MTLIDVNVGWQDDIAVGDAAGGHRSPVGGFNGRHFGGDAGVAVPLVPADVAAAGPEALRP